MKKQVIQKNTIIHIIVITLLFLPACSQDKNNYANTFQVYYINNDETGILTREHRTNNTDLVSELITMLGTISERLEYKAPLAGDFKLLEYNVSRSQITLNFNDAYNDQPLITEILVRAAIVRTLTQIDGIDNISMTIRGEPLTDGTGNIIGPMNADMFIDNVANELNAYERTNLRLYFADESGQKLTVVNRNDIIYHSNMAVERLIVESLVAGPLDEEEAAATINPASRVLGVTSIEGTCYVNFDDQFSQQLPGIDPEVIIFSIINSLIELPNINRVRISINGESPTIFETLNLMSIFERNLDIVH